MKQLFLSILSKDVKDNTYKFELAKFILDFSHYHPTEEDQVISYLFKNRRKVFRIPCIHK